KKTTQSVLVTVLDQTLRLLHPFMPFMTEEIWQALPHQGESLTVAAWPRVQAAWSFPEAEAEMALLMEVIRSVRNIRAEVN
ncbi:class I tRNA ligase family protein, partial [Frankia sp. Mgl5]|uniref:class I tRNA ligase family protein n=1 Tax=Frankia sp. Mgl5 TaxID=2933793 RepID=UPI00200E776D